MRRKNKKEEDKANGRLRDRQSKYREQDKKDSP